MHTCASLHLGQVGGLDIVLEDLQHCIHEDGKHTRADVLVGKQLRSHGTRHETQLGRGAVELNLCRQACEFSPRITIDCDDDYDYDYDYY